jgi:cell division protein FtsI (penicillin-binding protein 3)
MVDEPKGSLYYGGDVAAPVFANVAAGAMRLMSVAPDDLARVTPAVHAGEAP